MISRLGLSAITELLRRRGYEVRPIDEFRELPDLEPWVNEIAMRIRPFTMTSPERVAAVCMSIAYLVRNRIPGDVVECGVWRGGCSMAAALSLLRCGDSTRILHLFDTFEGMSAPSEFDRRYDGADATELRAAHTAAGQLWCYSPLDEVTRNMYGTGYPKEEIRFVKGKVEDTIPSASPKTIALLRLDTDWYESTKHELMHLFPRLVTGGVLVIDDYGHWEGARRAVDEYVEANGLRMLLARVDYTGRLAIKM